MPGLARQSLAVDVSQFDRGDIAFIIICGALVLFMVPGVAFLYSGLSRRKSALHLIWAVTAANAVVIFQWYFWGYSLAFSSTATNGFIGNLHNFGLKGVLADPSPGSPLLPELLYSFYQMEFACVTVAILMGALAERGRVMPALFFVFCWMTIVYCPLACWAWAPGGWGFTWGVLDYAGGGPVEIGSGIGGVAYSWVLGRRTERELLNFRPHNVSLVALGTFILWLGWLGFNAGSAFGANLRAIVAVWNSMLCAAFAGFVWCFLDYRVERKLSMVGFCSGTIAGLVAATPSSGYIPLWASVILGVVVGAVANYATKLKFLFRVDDALDLGAEHAIGGMIGLLFNGLFADSSIIALDGVNTSTAGGWINHNWKQLYVQFAYVCAATAYTFVVTALLAKVLDSFAWTRLRTTCEEEALGMDDVQLGEFVTDYVEVRRDFRDWTPAYDGAMPIHTKGDGSSDTNSSESRTAQPSPPAAGDRHGQPDLQQPSHHQDVKDEHNGLGAIDEKTAAEAS
ncbi:ammonium transporter [Trametopsis cervina]|nr:ammonium transporter [Trametopsis cervina]